LLFTEGDAARPTGIEVSPHTGGAAIDASESRPATQGSASLQANDRGASLRPSDDVRPSSTRFEVSRFCEAIRVGKPIACGPERAFHSAHACILANEAIAKRSPVAISRATNS